MGISENLQKIKKEIPGNVTLVAVSKTKTNPEILEAYHSGQRIFGENRVQELVQKCESLPKDIQWHLIGHLQTNKVKAIAPFVSLIHSVDSMKLLTEIDKEAKKAARIIDCLLEIRIAEEETKYGMTMEEAENILSSPELRQLQNIHIKGLMGIATFSENNTLVRSEFQSLYSLFKRLNAKFPVLEILSMGMSNDYMIAVEEGSTMIRVGSLIFGERKVEIV